MTADPSPFLTVQEVASFLRISTLTVRRWIETGDLPAIKAGRQYRIRRDDVDAFVLIARQPT